MAVVKTHAKGQIIVPKHIRDELGIKPGTSVSIRLVEDHAELRALPDDPIEYLTGILKDQPGSLSADLLQDRKRVDEIDEANSF
jgi:AbrB family looped-hinge helix DNA binding protein